MLKKLLLFLIFFFLFPSSVLAASVSAPSGLPLEVAINQSFTVSGEINGGVSGEKYFVKCRMGNSSSSLTEGQTYNALSSSWLGDGSAWAEMPVVEITDKSSFSLNCRLKSGLATGGKILFLRACLNQNGSCGNSFQSSSGVNFLALAEATPTPLPTTISSPTPTLTITPTLGIATPTPKPAATYKINEVKDKDGEILNSVKVYTDSIYIHHYTPEVLSFCDGCWCDDYTPCGFGQHLIKLEKTGYQDWSETKTISPGDFYEVSPVMIFSEADVSPTPTPVISFSPTPTMVLKTTLTLIPKSKITTVSGEILGQNTATLSSFYPYEKLEDLKKNQESTSSAQNKFWPKIFLILGLAMIFSSAFIGWRKVCYTQFK